MVDLGSGAGNEDSDLQPFALDFSSRGKLCSERPLAAWKSRLARLTLIQKQLLDSGHSQKSATGPDAMFVPPENIRGRQTEVLDWASLLPRLRHWQQAKRQHTE
jgi:hypothetical protein